MDRKIRPACIFLPQAMSESDQRPYVCGLGRRKTAFSPPFRVKKAIGT
jgi:hypothetical protein